MKRLIGILFCAFLFIGLQVFVNCSTPLESNDIDPPTPQPPRTDTLYVTDTVYSNDTLFMIDTLFLDDTLFIVDTIYVGDTLYLTDTVEVTDTFTVYDTINTVDTLTFTDTLTFVDTLTFIDTLFMSDTLYVTDTVNIIDTAYIEVPGGECPFTVCSYISKYHKKIYWKFPELDGEYRFKFYTEYGDKYNGGDDDDDDGHDGDCNNDCSLKKLKIHINNNVYFWEVGDYDTFIKELNVGPGTVVKVFPYTSKWCKHKLDVCLEITPL